MDFTSINKKGDKVNIHWYLTVADPAVRGGERNIKSMWSPLVAIFFMTYFYRAGGGMAPSALPQDPLLFKSRRYNCIQFKNAFVFFSY